MINKVIEVQSKSNDGWEQAARKALEEAAKSVSGIRSIYLRDLSAKVEDNKITEYRVNAKVTFEVDKKEEEPAPV